MPHLCKFRQAGACGFLENNLKPCPICPFAPVEKTEEKPPPNQGEAGKDGKVGPPGSEGPPGASTTGDKGIKGDKGDKGEMVIGPMGLTGHPGSPGMSIKGDKGDKGAKGDPGTVDKDWLKALEKRLGEAAKPQLLLGWGARTTKYTDAQAIAAVEGEPTLDLTGILTVDTDVFFVDPGNNYIGVGTAATNTSNQLHLLMTATKDILIDGSTNPREIDTGVMRWEQKPAIPDTRAITLNVDMNSQPGTHGLVINMVATQLAAGEIISLFDLEIDASNATGGHVHAMEMSQVGGNAIDIVMLHANPNIGVIHHDSGSFGNVETAFKYTGSWTDVTAAFNSDSSDVELFSADTDIIYIGMAATFDHIEAILATFASGPGIKPAFAFSDGAGGFTAFTPEDGTRGFRDSGIIEWHTPDLVGWSTDTVNSIGSKYWIRITRTHGGSITAPIEGTVQVQAVTNYSWDKDGKVNLSSLFVDAINYAADAGASDTYAVTITPGPSAYAVGQVFYFKANTINTGAATLNVNSLGEKTIKKLHDQDLANGDIEAGQIVMVAYDGTNFQMLSQIAN